MEAQEPLGLPQRIRRQPTVPHCVSRSHGFNYHAYSLCSGPVRKFWAGSPHNHLCGPFTKLSAISYVCSVLYIFRMFSVIVPHLTFMSQGGIGHVGSISSSSSFRAKRTEAQSKFIVQARGTQSQVSRPPNRVHGSAHHPAKVESYQIHLSSCPIS